MADSLPASSPAPGGGPETFSPHAFAFGYLAWMPVGPNNGPCPTRLSHIPILPVPVSPHTRTCTNASNPASPSTSMHATSFHFPSPVLLPRTSVRLWKHSSSSAAKGSTAHSATTWPSCSASVGELILQLLMPADTASEDGREREGGGGECATCRRVF